MFMLGMAAWPMQRAFGAFVDVLIHKSEPFVHVASEYCASSCLYNTLVILE